MTPGDGCHLSGSLATGVQEAETNRSPVLVVPEVTGADPSGSRARTGLVLLPFLIMALVAAADVLAGPRFGFLSLLSLGPALAAVALSPRQTVLMGGLAVALSVLLAAYDDLLISGRWLLSFATIAGVTAAGVVASAGRQRRERELANVRAVAEAAQRVLLRPLPAEAREFSIAVRYISAAAAAKIGGDLYDVIVSAGTVRLIVADVQGKGLEAVQTASVVLGAFREAAHDACDLAGLAARIELSLERQAGEEEFATAVLAQIPVGGDSIEILNCGHPPPLLLTGGSASLAEPPETCLPLGLPGWRWPRPNRMLSSSSRGTGSCSIPTASARHETGPGPSTRLTAVLPCWPDRTRMPRWAACATTSSGT